MLDINWSRWFILWIQSNFIQLMICVYWLKWIITASICEGLFRFCIRLILLCRLFLLAFYDAATGGTLQVDINLDSFEPFFYTSGLLRLFRFGILSKEDQNLLFFRLKAVTSLYGGHLIQAFVEFYQLKTLITSFHSSKDRFGF